MLQSWEYNLVICTLVMLLPTHHVLQCKSKVQFISWFVYKKELVNPPMYAVKPRATMESRVRTRLLQVSSFHAFGVWEQKCVSLVKSISQAWCPPLSLVQYEVKEVFQLASCLDPCFKLQWCEEEEIEKVKQLLVKKVLIPQTEERNLQPPTKKSKLFCFMDKAKELVQVQHLTRWKNICQQ